MVCCGRGRGAALVTGAAKPTYVTISYPPGLAWTGTSFQLLQSQTFPDGSTATPSGLDMPPPENGEPGAGDPSGRSSATVSLATPATKMSPSLARATPKGFDTPMFVNSCARFGSPPGYCVTLSPWQLAIQMLPWSSATVPWGNEIPPWV